MNPPSPPKAHRNTRFLESADARTIRILAEYLEPLQRFRRRNVRDTVVIFGSARARDPAEVERELAALRRQRHGARRSRRLRDLEQQLELARYYREARELARLLTQWARTLGPGHRFVICTGGGPGIMEAANRGATEDAGGPSIGLTISLPREERPNRYISPQLAFQFHYFFMRKLWFVYMAAALVIFPGGFGTLDELFEVLTLVQTRKIHRPLPIVLYGSRFWNDGLRFDALVRWGTISPNDLRLFHRADTPQECFRIVRSELERHYMHPTSAIRPQPRQAES